MRRRNSSLGNLTEHSRDSWRDPICHFLEDVGSYNGLWNTSRGQQRYDPQSRRYVQWAVPDDWFGLLSGPNGEGYPRFTLEEWKKMHRTLARGGQIRPHKMGNDWHHDGPRVGLSRHNCLKSNADFVAEIQL